MEKQTYLILFGTEPPLTGGVFVGQTFSFPIGIIEKKKFQSFIEEYKQRIEKYLTETFKKCSVDNDASFFKHELHELEGEINLYISFDDGSSHNVQIKFSEFEPNTFKHNNSHYRL